MSEAQQQVPAQGQPQQQAPAQGEQLIAGKFKSQDELVAAYQQAEKKIGELTSKPAAKSDALTIQPAPTVKSTEVLEQVYAKRSKGEELTDADFATLDKAGVSRSFAETFFEGRDAVFEQTKAKVHSIAGTPDQYQNMLKWAATGLSKEEADAYNEAMASRNIHKMSLAVAGLKAKFQQQFGAEGNMLGGQRGGSSGAQPYANQAEWLKDTGSMKYRSDDNFRASVNARLEASMKAGTIK